MLRGGGAGAEKGTNREKLQKKTRYEQIDTVHSQKQRHDERKDEQEDADESVNTVQPPDEELRAETASGSYPSCVSRSPRTLSKLRS